MYDLLDYIVKNYQNGGYINPFNPSESPTQSGVLSSSGIDLTDDKYKAFIPTYDQTGEDFLRTNYAQKREGSYSTARDTLGQLGQKSRETKAQQDFAGSGKSLLDTTRKDIVDQFSMDADSMYTGLQQDVTGMRRGYKEDVLASIGDLPQDAYTIDENYGTTPTDYLENPDNAVVQGINSSYTSGWSDTDTPEIGTQYTDEFGSIWEVTTNQLGNLVWLLIDG